MTQGSYKTKNFKPVFFSIFSKFFIQKVIQFLLHKLISTLAAPKFSFASPLPKSRSEYNPPYHQREQFPDKALNTDKCPNKGSRAKSSHQRPYSSQFSASNNCPRKVPLA